MDQTGQMGGLLPSGPAHSPRPLAGSGANELRVLTATSFAPVLAAGREGLFTRPQQP
jgi:hypothetical protein